MNYWDFLGAAVAFVSSWFFLSAVLAVVTIAGAIVGGVAGVMRLADANKGAWNWVFVPAVVVVAFLIITFLAWSGVGSAVAS